MMVAFMRGSIVDGAATASTTWLLSYEDLELGDWHVSLTDQSRQHLMSWASGAPVVIEVHSHGDLGGPACLSKTDLDGLAAWVPHLSWRIPGVTYIALVFGAESFDGLAWQPGLAAVPVGSVIFDGVATWRATGKSLRRWEQLHG